MNGYILRKCFIPLAGLILLTCNSCRREPVDAEKKYQLGVKYRDGKGVTKDPSEAFKWFRKAADQGHAEAQVTVASFYMFGGEVPYDPAEAIRWYRKAADQGHSGAEFLLGSNYAIGRGVPEDAAEAAMWFRKSADHGFDCAQLELGLCYAEGKGVTKDLVKAYMWLDIAATWGRIRSGNDREELSRKMSKDQVAEARRLSREWTSGKTVNQK